MLHIFISHSSADSAIAQKLYDDLKNTGHDIVVDSQILRMGEDFITFMNESLETADIIIFLHSKATKTAKWQRKELTAAICQETHRGDASLVVLRVDDSPLPPLLAPKV